MWIVIKLYTECSALLSVKPMTRTWQRSWLHLLVIYVQIANWILLAKLKDLHDHCKLCISQRRLLRCGQYLLICMCVPYTPRLSLFKKQWICMCMNHYLFFHLWFRVKQLLWGLWFVFQFLFHYYIDLSQNYSGLICLVYIIWEYMIDCSSFCVLLGLLL